MHAVRNGIPSAAWISSPKLQYGLASAGRPLTLTARLFCETKTQNFPLRHLITGENLLLSLPECLFSSDESFTNYLH